MTTLEAAHSISTDEQHGIVHFTIGGLWTEEGMTDFLTNLAEAAMPFIKKGRSFSVIGDLREFVAQDRETAAAIRNSLMTARQNGLERFAVVTESSLVKLQYRRITEGLVVEFFDEPSAARDWLRHG